MCFNTTVHCTTFVINYLHTTPREREREEKEEIGKEGKENGPCFKMALISHQRH